VDPLLRFENGVPKTLAFFDNTHCFAQPFNGQCKPTSKLFDNSVDNNAAIQHSFIGLSTDQSKSSSLHDMGDAGVGVLCDEDTQGSSSLKKNQDHAHLSSLLDEDTVQPFSRGGLGSDNMKLGASIQRLIPRSEASSNGLAPHGSQKIHSRFDTTMDSFLNGDPSSKRTHHVTPIDIMDKLLPVSGDFQSNPGGPLIGQSTTQNQKLSLANSNVSNDPFYLNEISTNLFFDQCFSIDQNVAACHSESDGLNVRQSEEYADETELDGRPMVGLSLDTGQWNSDLYATEGGAGEDLGNINVR